MTEEDTFNKLRRTPFLEVLEALRIEFKKFPINPHGGKGVNDLDQSWREYREDFIHSHHWKWDDFVVKYNEYKLRTKRATF